MRLFGKVGETKKQKINCSKCNKHIGFEQDGTKDFFDGFAINSGEYFCGACAEFLRLTGAQSYLYGIDEDTIKSNQEIDDFSGEELKFIWIKLSSEDREKFIKIRDLVLNKHKKEKQKQEEKIRKKIDKKLKKE